MVTDQSNVDVEDIVGAYGEREGGGGEGGEGGVDAIVYYVEDEVDNLSLPMIEIDVCDVD